MADNKKNVGQIIQIARGNLFTRLTQKPLAKGELFVHIADAAVPTTGTTVLDLVTNSNIQKVFKGDLFVGDNSNCKVYAVGSGGALKWGGILFSGTTYDEAVNKAKSLPNFVFMYNGNAVLYPDLTEANRPRSIADASTDPTQPEEVHKSYVADSSTEWNDPINPGDLLFYNPALDQVVVLHLSRSTDALTKINVDELVSNSMQNLLSEAAVNKDGTVVDPATLKKFLDGPVRHYQYLVDGYGWKPVTISTECSIEIDENDGAVTRNPGRVSLPAAPVDGTIFYIPFNSSNPGQNVYTLSTNKGVSYGSSIINRQFFYEGDLFFTLPADNGGVTFECISLYGGLLDQFRFDRIFDRADEYATDVWRSTAEGSDIAWMNGNKTIQDFIERLFTTKVDIDPKTKKIIASQLPDYLLGAPKYLGTLDDTQIDWNNLVADTTAYEFANSVNTSWKNIDGNEDDDTTDKANSGAEAESSDTKLQSGCYWIYKGTGRNIEGFPGIFNFADVKKDDITSGQVQDGVIKEHRLEPGDWIIYNGETGKFDILDNSSSFIGILVGNVKTSGVVEFKSDTVNIDVRNLVDNKGLVAVTSTTSTYHEDIDINASNDKITFDNKYKVFAGLNSWLTSDFLPAIVGKDTTTGNAVLGNSGFRFIGTPGEIGYGLKVQNADEAHSTSFSWHVTIEDYDNGSDYSPDIFDAALGMSRIFNSAKSLYNGLDFGEFSFTDGGYGFTLNWSDNAKLALPGYNGILTTEGYVNKGFEVVKDIIEDLYDAVNAGDENWLQTVIIENETKKLGNSHVRQLLNEDKYYLDIFCDLPANVNDTSNDLFSRIGIYEDISTANANQHYDAPLDVILGEGESAKKLNPSELEGHPENILPNHSGVLLNNNSVIDGGEWL